MLSDRRSASVSVTNKYETTSNGTKTGLTHKPMHVHLHREVSTSQSLSGAKLEKIRIVHNKHAGGEWMPSKTMLHATSIALLTGWNRSNLFWAEKYGMNNASRRWWNILDKALRSSGMVPTRADRFCCVLCSIQSRKQAWEHWTQDAIEQQNGTKDAFT